MKIIQVISSLGNGGAEKLVVELSNELAAEHEVTILSLKAVEDWMFPPKHIRENVKLIALNKSRGFTPGIIFKLIGLIRAVRPDVVHIHLTAPLYYFLPVFPFFRKTRFYHTIHNSFGLHHNLYAKLNLWPFYHRVMNVCLSQSIYDPFRKAFPKMKFTKIENGIKEMICSDEVASITNEIEAFRGKPDRKILLYIGRLSYQKNIPLLLEVFKDYPGDNARLILIGEGPSELMEMVNRETGRPESRILYLGPRDHVADYLTHTDALILTSLYEGMPIVILEALSVGLPVISTPVGGVPDLITDGVNGFLSSSLRKEDIIDAIEKFFRLTKEETDRMHAANKNLFSEKYSIQACAAKHSRMYRDGVSRKA